MVLNGTLELFLIGLGVSLFEIIFISSFLISLLFVLFVWFLCILCVSYRYLMAIKDPTAELIECKINKKIFFKNIIIFKPYKENELIEFKMKQ